MYTLLIGDDRGSTRAIARALRAANHRIDRAPDGGLGLLRAASGIYDVIVLAAPLPDVDGVAACRRVWEGGIGTPLLLLTATDAVDDRIQALDAGADDCLGAPFAVAELLARVNALGRRGDDRVRGGALRVGDLALNLGDHRVERAGRQIALTRKEVSILEYLMRHAGRILSKEQIVRHVWGDDTAAPANLLETHIHHLRDKLDRGFPEPRIGTIRGMGYVLRR